jgi:hypothetical protein
VLRPDRSFTQSYLSLPSVGEEVAFMGFSAFSEPAVIGRPSSIMLEKGSVPATSGGKSFYGGILSQADMPPGLAFVARCISKLSGVKKEV